MKIMVCYDGSEVAKDAARLGVRHAGVFDGQVFLVASMKGGRDIPRKAFQDREKELERQRLCLKEDGFDCQTAFLVRGLSAGEDLVAYAENNNIDEIIIGVKKRSKVGKLIFGSTAQYVILNAPCPVITVR